MRRILIIGAGIAGVSAAESARRHYPDADITIVSSDGDGFYNRIAIGGYAVGKRTLPGMRFAGDTFFSRLRIVTRFGTAATHVSTRTREIVLDDGPSLPWDRLILATGAKPFVPAIPGIDGPGIHCLWTLRDAMDLREILPRLHDVAILGGGVLGVEAALDFQAVGHRVTLVEQKPWLLPAQLHPEDGRCLNERVARHGVAVRTDVCVSEIRTAERGPLLVMSDGTSVSCELLLLCAGAVPDTRLAVTAGIRVDRGIVIDEYLRTNVASILACGNCTNPGTTVGLLWNPAAIQGHAAGANAFDTRMAYTPTTHPIHLKSSDLPLFAIGPTDLPEGATVVVEAGTDARGPWRRMLVIDADRRIHHGAFVGRTAGSWSIESAVRRRTAIAEDILRKGQVQDIIDHLTPPREHTPTGPGWVCRMCGYTHEGGDAPDICPVCGVGKDQFLAA